MAAFCLQSASKTNPREAREHLFISPKTIDNPGDVVHRLHEGKAASVMKLITASGDSRFTITRASGTYAPKSPYTLQIDKIKRVRNNEGIIATVP